MRATRQASSGTLVRRSVLRLVGLAAGAAVAVTSMALPAQAAPAGPASVSSLTGTSAAGSYIVRAHPGRLAELGGVLAGRGIGVRRQIGIIDAVVVDLPAGAADELRADRRVASVTANAAVQLLSSTYLPGQDVNSQYSLQNMVGSRTWWNKYTGAGVDVAVVDSGVTPVFGLSDAGKILNGPDLTPESQNASTRYLDTYGHGTHMAGIIAGHDTGVDPATNAGNSTPFMGVAPNARIVSVKVADAHGNSDVSQVIAGIDWVVQHARDPGMNIRVMNLSFGTNSAQAYTLDPLAFAVEKAWKSGIVVVVSAGNSGSADGRLTNPATNPFVIAVGADDLNGTSSISDDTIPAFSSIGDGKRNPDLVAPGAHIQSLRVPGSYVDAMYASSGAIDSRYFRGSGTSQAAAFVSGAVALMLQKNPAWTPNAVKLLLMSTASPLPKANARGQGKGLINMANMAAAKDPGKVTQSFAASTGTGTLEASRGDAHLMLGGVTLAGEKDIHGKAFNAAAMATLEAAGSSWAGGVWNGSSWSGSSWAGSSWASTAWTGSSWSGSSWSGSSWSSGSWNGSSWSSTNWSGSSWSGSSWSGSAWAGKAWADDSWS